MEIATKYNMGDTVYYLERKRISEQCPACGGNKRVNVTTGAFRWNIKCPTCNGKGKKQDIVSYRVTTGRIKGVIIKRGDHSMTKYILDNGVHRLETKLFSNIEQAEEKCLSLNNQLEEKSK